MLISRHVAFANHIFNLVINIEVFDGNILSKAQCCVWWKCRLVSNLTNRMWKFFVDYTYDSGRVEFY